MATNQDIFEPEYFYHIYNKTVGNELLFTKKANYVFFLEKYKKYLIPVVNTYAYCLMNNHFHFLIQIKEEKILKKFETHVVFENTNFSNIISKQFSHFFNSYVQAFNKQEDRKGSLLKNRFKRVRVTDEGYLKKLILYIHLNPIHHSISASFEEWKYSSYKSILSKNHTNLCRKEVIDLFENLENFRFCHYKDLDMDDKYILE